MNHIDPFLVLFLLLAMLFLGLYCYLYIINKKLKEILAKG